MGFAYAIRGVIQLSDFASFVSPCTRFNCMSKFVRR
jgi:hypothetical protein